MFGSIYPEDSKNKALYLHWIFGRGWLDSQEWLVKLFTRHPTSCSILFEISRKL